MTVPTSPRTNGRPRDGPVSNGDPGWRANLGEAWPLLVVGGACVAVAVVMALGRLTRLVDHLSPSFLFLAVGLTGIAGGVASYLVGSDVESTSAFRHMAPAPPRLADTTGPAAVSANQTHTIKPGPNPVSADHTSPRPRAPGRPSPMRWGPAEGSNEMPRSLLLDPRLLQRPAPSKGRLLRLSEEGALTVYSMGDAFRDLDIVTRAVHERRARLAGEVPAPKDGTDEQSE